MIYEYLSVCYYNETVKFIKDVWWAYQNSLKDLPVPIPSNKERTRRGFRFSGGTGGDIIGGD